MTPVDGSTTPTVDAASVDASVPVPRDDGGGSTIPPFSRYLCDEAPPPGAATPAPPPTYAGTCPTLVAGPNTLTSSGATREFRLHFPDDVAVGEQLPVFFFWHWLGGSASSFVERGDLLAASQQQRFVAVVPESKDDIFTKWPYSIVDSDARVAEEVQFFDDMLACVVEQLSVNTQCVVSAGVSAGALWTSQLAGRRGDLLSSIIVLSGGTGGGSIRPWVAPDHHMPALVLWGGSGDQCIILNFQTTSRDLETHLVADGHFLVECIHNCGHTVPPVEAPAGMSQFAPMWEFGFNHPFWLRDGESPYAAGGLPAYFPAWCGVGMGAATPRTAMCTSGSAC